MKKIIYFVTEDWYFCSHRLQHAIAAISSGFEVCLITKVQLHRNLIENAGIKLIPTSLERRVKNPLRELNVIVELISIYRRERPDIVHHVSMKPVLYGSIAAIFSKIPFVVNAVAGLGYVFISNSLMVVWLRPILRALLQYLFNRPGCRVILQNPDDYAVMQDQVGVVPEHLKLIRGSGVDLQMFPLQPFFDDVPLVILPARMLWDKGVGEFVQAAAYLLEAGIKARFALVGEPDLANPAAISLEQLQSWGDLGIVEVWGRREDMPKVYGLCHIVCLPSYREGLPKSLLEAAASGRPIVATDAPGCREIVIDEENGLLVPVKDVMALMHALRRLIEDPAMRLRMGIKGRQLVENEFSVDKIASETLDVYRELFNEGDFREPGAERAI